MNNFNPHISVRADTRKLVFGKKAVLASFIDQLAEDMRWAQEHMNNAPCLLGEFGLPFDLYNKKAYKTGNYTRHIQALDLYYTVIERLFLNATIWNYTPDNTNAHGDGWNDEDLSIWGDGHERAQEGWQRPYPRANRNCLPGIINGRNVFIYSEPIRRQEALPNYT